MAAAWGLQTKMATWSRTTVTMFLSGGGTAVGSEGKKLMRGWEQKGTLIFLVCECGEKLEKGFLCCNVWLLELMIKRKETCYLTQFVKQPTF